MAGDLVERPCVGPVSGHTLAPAMTMDPANPVRYARQVAFAGLGPAGQRKLMQARALIVGVGGLGSWTAELLARAGVGFLRLADADTVELTNIHRQALYGQAQAARGTPKVQAAAERIRQINSNVVVEPVGQRLERGNIDSLAGDVQVVLDGTDNFPTRFLLNDYSVKYGRPWIFAGVVAAEAQTMTVLPDRRPCLRCIYEAPPPPCADPSCRTQGVLGPAVAAIAAIQAIEAIKILAGQLQAVSPYLLKMNLWDNTFQRIDALAACAEVPCPCCQQKDFEFLDG